MKIFRLNRKSDPSNVSGEGAVAYGVELNNGQVILIWHGDRATLEIVPSISLIESIHGHSGLSRVEFLPTSKQFIKKLEDFISGADLKEKK